MLTAAQERSLSISEAHEFTSLTGHGVRARVGDGEVLVWSGTLMEKEGFPIESLLERDKRFEREGKTVTFIASGAKRWALSQWRTP